MLYQFYHHNTVAATIIWPLHHDDFYTVMTIT